MFKFVLLFCSFAGLSKSLSPFPKLLLISFDGFRYDLLNETFVPNIAKWASNGSWFTSGVRSQYVTYTAPNHMSIVTGLYEENHGIVSNYFYDEETKQHFDYFNSTHKEGVVNASQAEFWFKGDPIWLTNERSDKGRKSGTLYWPNGESPFPYIPHKPNFFEPWTVYGTLKDWMKDVDKIIELFTRKEDPVNFVAWYVAEPDHVLHTNGFYNGELRKKLTELDELFQYFVKVFYENENNLGDNVNIILTADHGHAEIKDEKHVMCIPDFVQGGGFEMGDHMIYPKDDAHAKEIYNNLTEAIKKHGFKVSVHYKEEFPERYHYKNTSRVGRIIFEPEVGSAISFSCTADKMTKTYGPEGTTKFNSSTHGMDPDRAEMRAMLIMNGPAFAEGIKIEDIPNNIDLYGLMCQLLGINSSRHDGTLSIVQKALKSYQQTHPQHSNTYIAITDSMGIAFILVPSMCIVILFMVYGLRNTVWKKDPNWGRTDASMGYRPLSNPDDVDAEVGRRSNNRSTGELNNGTVTMSGLLDEFSDDEI